MTVYPKEALDTALEKCVSHVPLAEVLDFVMDLLIIRAQDIATHVGVPKERVRRWRLGVSVPEAGMDAKVREYLWAKITAAIPRPNALQ